MEDLARWTVSEGGQLIWIALSFAVMLVPMILLTLWYHGRIGRTEGGRRLMAEQDANRPWKGKPNLRAGARMAGGIEEGAYGEHARRMQRRVYLVVAVWLIACVVMFGLMIWGSALQETP